jgi:hypothetical protein
MAIHHEENDTFHRTYGKKKRVKDMNHFMFLTKCNVVQGISHCLGLFCGRDDYTNLTV